MSKLRGEEDTIAYQMAEVRERWADLKMTFRSAIRPWHLWLLVIAWLLLVLVGCTDAAAPKPATPELVYRAANELNYQLRQAFGRGEHYSIAAFNTDTVVPASVAIFRKP